MAKAPAFQWYPNDYLRDTRVLSLSTRGAWADMLNFMWYAEERGVLSGTEEQLSRMLSCSVDEIKNVITELTVTRIANVTNANGVVTVVNRRMFREDKERKSTRLRVQKFRNVHCNTPSNADVAQPSSSSSSSNKESIKKEKIQFEKNHFLNIPEDLKTKWQTIAPGISVETEITKAEAWVLSNPKLKKSNWSRFLTNWIVRAQDHATRYGGNGNGNSSANRTYQKHYRTERDVINEEACDEADTIAKRWLKQQTQQPAAIGDS